MKKRILTKGKVCEAKYCRNRKPSQNGYLLLLCWKCKSKQLKAKQPATYFLNTLRGSAKKRNIEFNLTLAEFKQWCKATNFLARRGLKPDDLTIDRIDWNKGYTIDNIRPLERRYNSAQGKYNVPRYMRKYIEQNEG